jgi:hypothetical protein
VRELNDANALERQRVLPRHAVLRCSRRGAPACARQNRW